MPKSSPNGKKWTKEKIKNLIQHNSNLLDIGCGRGTYKDLFKDIDVIANSNWVAVEVWKPYISQFNLEAKYNKIINEDARSLNWDDLGQWDLIFMGDVLEHMTKEQAQTLVDVALKHTKHILISIPIVYMPQGADGGNEYEIHVKPDWTDKEVLESFPNIVEHHKEGKIGVYLLKGSL